MNTTSLKQFQALWGPVLDMIPAVIAAVEGQADLDRAIAARKAELAETEDKIDAAIAEGNRRLEVVNAKLAEAQDAHTAYAVQMDVERINLRSVIAGLEQQSKDLDAAVKAKAREVQKQVAKVEKDAAAKTTATLADAEAHAAGVAQAIADLEAKRALAAAALDELRAKIG
jgi:hypothetical protein